MHEGTLLLAQAEPSVSLSTVIQGVLLGLIIIFVFTVFTVGFVAKKLDIYQASYGKAFIAVFLINLISMAATVIMFSMGLPGFVRLLVIMAGIPIVMYKVVFSCNMTQAALVWLGSTIIQVVVGFLLGMAGLFSAAALFGG